MCGFSLSLYIVTLGVSNDIAAVHLHKVRFDKKAGFAASRAANDKDVFIPRILGAFGSAVHGKPFCLGQQDVVVKFRVYVRLNVLCISP